MNRKFMLLGALFVASLITCNVISTKLWTIGGIVMSTGILTYGLTFLFLNVINEVWGKKAAADIVWVGFLINIFTLVVFKLAVLMPPLDPEANKAFAGVVDLIPRIMLACNAAYLVAQYQNIWLFNWIKKLTNGRMLWARNNASTIVSHTLDSAIFYVVAFAPIGLTSNEMGWGALFSGLLISSIFKFMMALADTPFCYLLVHGPKMRR